MNLRAAHFDPQQTFRPRRDFAAQQDFGLEQEWSASEAQRRRWRSQVLRGLLLACAPPMAAWLLLVVWACEALTRTLLHLL